MRGRMLTVSVAILQAQAQCIHYQCLIVNQLRPRPKVVTSLNPSSCAEYTYEERRVLHADQSTLRYTLSEIGNTEQMISFPAIRRPTSPGEDSGGI